VLLTVYRSLGGFWEELPIKVDFQRHRVDLAFLSFEIPHDVFRLSKICNGLK
jgi:hypothetical protein